MNAEVGQREKDTHVKRAPDNFEDDEDDIGDVEEGGKTAMRGQY